MEEEMAKLRQELSEKTSNLIAAAKIGQALAEENSSLKDKLNEVVKDYSGKVEEKQQEVYSMQLKLDRYAKLEDWFQMETASLRQDLAHQQESAQEEIATARLQEAAPLRSKIEHLQADLDQALADRGQLEERAAQLEALMQEQLNQSCSAASRTQDLSELEALQQDNLALGSELTVLKAKVIEQESELKRARQEVEAGRARLESQAREVEELQCQITSYINALEKSRMEMLETRAQMDALRLETGDHKRKGNSLFSELDDRRVMAEKKLISLKTQLDASEQKLEMERQQNNKLKMRLMMVLQMGGSSEDSERVQRLRSQLMEARAEVNQLVEERQHREKEEGKLADRLAALGSGGQSDSDKNYTQYLIAIINSKEKEMEEVKRELKGLQLQLLARSSAELEQDRRIQELEAERKKYHAQAMKLSLKNEELLLKYDPDQVKSRDRVLRGITEKVPLGEAGVEDSALDFSLSWQQQQQQQPGSSAQHPPSTSSASSSLSSSCAASKVVPAENGASKCEGIPGLDLTFPPLLADDEEDVLQDATNTMAPQEGRGAPGGGRKGGKARGVAMCEEVQVHFQDGHQETTSLATDPSSSDKAGSKVPQAKENTNSGRPKGRKVYEVKNVSDQPVNNCKTQ